MKRKSKAEMVLEIYDREAMGEVSRREIELINLGLIEEFGEGGILSPAEIASILTDEDLPVKFDEVFNMNTPEDRYEQLLSSIIDVSTLSAAEQSLQKLQSVHASLLHDHDRRGTQYTLQLARDTRNAALRDASNQDLTLRRQAELREIGEWFTIWLQSPSLLEHWLELRKATGEFRRLFPSAEEP